MFFKDKRKIGSIYATCLPPHLDTPYPIQWSHTGLHFCQFCKEHKIIKLNLQNIKAEPGTIAQLAKSPPFQHWHPTLVLVNVPTVSLPSCCLIMAWESSRG